MVVLVGYASLHGSTKGVAERVAARLGERGYGIDLRPVDQVESAEPYDAIVLGSAIHDGAWMPEAITFVRANARTLASLPVWLFSLGMLGQQGSAFRPAVARRLRALGRGRRYVDTVLARDRRACRLAARGGRYVDTAHALTARRGRGPRGLRVSTADVREIPSSCS